MQGLVDQAPVLGLAVLDERALHGLLVRVARHVDGLHVARVHARVVHAGAHGGRGGVEVLDLLGHVAHVAHGLGQLHGLLHGAAWVRADEVGHHVLLLAGAARDLLEAAAEGVVDRAGRLAHGGQDRVAHVLGRQAQLAAHVVVDQLLEELVGLVGQGVVKADAAAHEDLLHAGKLAQVAQELGVGVLLDHHVLAERGPHAAAVAAHAAGGLLVARGPAEVCRGAADVGDVALEVRVCREGTCLLHDALVAPYLQDAPLVEGDGAEAALAKAAAVGRNGEAHLVKVEGRYATRGVVVRVPRAGVGQLVDGVQLGRGEWRLRRVLHHEEVVGRVGLHQAVGRHGVHVAVLHGKAAGVVEAIRTQVVKGGEKVVVVDLVQRVGLVDRPADPGDLVDGKTGVQGLRHLHDGLFAHAVEDEVGAGVKQDGALEGVRPVVVVGKAAQARLDAAQHDGGVLVRAADEVGVDHAGVVGARPHDAPGGVEVLAAAALGYGVMVDHGVHVAGGDQEGQAGLAQDGNALGVVPVRLANHAHLEAVGLQGARDDGHAKAGVVHVGVSADVDEVALLPAAGLHVGAADGEKRLARGTGGVCGRVGLAGCVRARLAAGVAPGGASGLAVRLRPLAVLAASALGVALAAVGLGHGASVLLDWGCRSMVALRGGLCDLWRARGASVGRLCIRPAVD